MTPAGYSEDSLVEQPAIVLVAALDRAVPEEAGA